VEQEASKPARPLNRIWLTLSWGVLDLAEAVEPLAEHVGARFEKNPVAVRLDNVAHEEEQLANVLPKLSGLPHRRHMHGFPDGKRID
jgi:hypothetical protein